jgi:hypothetical protein
LEEKTESMVLATEPCPDCGSDRHRSCDPLENTRKWSMKMYDDFQPIRDIIKGYPELRESIIETIGEAMTQNFANNFYAGMKPPEKNL